MQPISREDLETRYTQRVTHISGILRDLARCAPSNVQIDNNLSVENNLEVFQANIGLTQPIVQDSDEALIEEGNLRKEILAMRNSLDVPSLVIFNRWWEVLNTATEFDTSTRTVRRLRREHVAILQANRAAAARLQRELDQVRPATPPTPPTPPVPAVVRMQAKLAPTTVPEFNGNKLEFHTWFNMFEALIDETDMSPVAKFVNLKNCLRGEPLRKIRHLKMTEGDYRIAKGIIQRTYGKKETVIKAVRNKLRNTPLWYGRQGVKDGFNYAESFIQQLTTLTEVEYNSDETLDTLTGCLPESYLERLQVYKRKGTDPWDLAQFREAMMEIIEDDDDMADVTRGRERVREQEQKPKPGRSTNFKGKPSQSTMSFSAVQNVRHGKKENKTQVDSAPGKQITIMQRQNDVQLGQVTQRKQKSCLFCGNLGHPIWKCPMDSRARSQVILQLKRCTRCLQEGHFNKQCQAEGCRKCGSAHHTFLHYDPVGQVNPGKYGIQPMTQLPAQPTMTAASYSPGYMVTGNVAGNMGYQTGIGYPFIQPTYVPNVSYQQLDQSSSSRRTGNRQFNTNPRGAMSQPSNGANWPNQATRTVAGHTAQESNKSTQVGPTNQIVTYNEAKPTVTTNPEGTEVQLMSRVVKAINPDSSRQIEMNTGLMLDLGSTGTYITSELSNKLKLLNGPKKEIGLIRFGDHSASAQIKGNLNVLGIKDTEGNVLRVRGIVVPELLPSIPCVQLQSSELDQLRECGAVPPRRSLKPGILLGMDYLKQIKLRFVENLPSGYCVYDSTIGPFVCGKPNGQEGESSCATVMAAMAAITATSDIAGKPEKAPEKNHELYDMVQRYFTMESAGYLGDNNDPSEDEMVHANFLDTVRYEETLDAKPGEPPGRYIVRLPWKKEGPNPDVNFGRSMGRLKSTLTKLRRTPEVLEQYNQIMVDQVNAGILEPAPFVDHSKPPDKLYYMPHQPVIKETSSTTKLRIVCDASDGDPSLNDCLYRGKVYAGQDEKAVCTFLAKTRLFPNVLVADLEKAFLQIRIADEDKDSNRLLWPEDPANSDRPRVYRFTRVMFGIISSPYLLGATVEHHLSQVKSELAGLLTKGVYVDNFIIPIPSPPDIYETAEEIRRIFWVGGFNCRQFNSNCQKEIQTLPEEWRDDRSEISLLGVT